MNRSQRRGTEIGWGRRAFLCAAVFAAGTVSGCGRSGSKNTYAPPPPPEVIVAFPVERELTDYLRYTGVVEASETVELRARVQGFLEQITFQPGQRVKKGDLLFVIDKRLYQAQVDKAAAEVKAQEASLAGAENDARLARELADERAGPEIDALIKAANRDAIAAQLKAAQAALAQAMLDLEFCEVHSPIDGRITRNLVDVGNLVGRDEPTLLATVVKTQPVFVTVEASESDILSIRRRRLEQGQTEGMEPGQIAPGQWRPAELELSDEAEFPTRGHVDYVEPRLNRQTGTLRVRARFENERDLLLPGLFARVRFPLETYRAIVVPEAALLRDQQGRFALVVNARDEVETRRVRIGALHGPLRVVVEGLTTTDRVVIQGVMRARQGAKVTPKVETLDVSSTPAPAAGSADGATDGADGAADS